jgi:hypothetical protein
MLLKGFGWERLTLIRLNKSNRWTTGNVQTPDM